MSKMYVGPFSINLLRGERTLHFRPLKKYELPWLADAIRNAAATGELVAFIGHEDTAKVAASSLGLEISLFNRTQVKIEFAPGQMRKDASIETTDQLYVFQVEGRLPEGATSLPEGAIFAWWQVESAEYSEYRHRAAVSTKMATQDVRKSPSYLSGL